MELLRQYDDPKLQLSLSASQWEDLALTRTLFE